MTKKKDQGEYLNPINKVVYRDFDKFLEELDLDNWKVVEFVDQECEYLKLIHKKSLGVFVNTITNRWDDHSLRVYECPDGSLWGYESRRWNDETPHSIGGKGIINKTIRTIWEFA